MARRIVVTVLALIAALLGLIAVPLGLITARQDSEDFRQETAAAAVTLANLAEEWLGDHSQGPALGRTIAQMSVAGDRVSVYDHAGRRVAGTMARPSVRRDQLTRALASAPAGHSAAAVSGDDRVLVVAPVLPDGGGTAIGAVVLSRPAGTLDQRIAALWAWIGGLAAAGLAAAALISAALAKWVSRPLSSLDAAALKLGSSALDTRAPDDAGPIEIRRLAISFNTMAARLQNLLHGHQAMMADVSHQLRTPLAALRLRLDVLAQDASEPVAAELAGAQEEIARLSRMVDGLLALARAENVTTGPVQVAVDAVIRDRVAAWRLAAEERDVTLSVPDTGRASAMLGDGQLEQILDNLLANALDAVPAGARIGVRAATLGSQTQIVVTDDGPGMSDRQRQAAFRRFATARPGGTGLGLAIVHRLVTANGGTASLSDTPGGGLTVTVQLPAVPRERGARRPGTFSS